MYLLSPLPQHFVEDSNLIKINVNSSVEEENLKGREFLKEGVQEKRRAVLPELFCLGK